MSRLQNESLPKSGDRVSAYIEQFRACLKDPNKPFALVARIPVKDGTQARFEAAFSQAIAATRREAGVLTFHLNREATNGTRYLVYERWKSLSDLENHLRTPYIATLMSITDEVLAAVPEFQVLVPAGE